MFFIVGWTSNVQAWSLLVASLLHAAVEEVIHVEVWFPAISGCHPAKMCRNAMRGCIFSHLHGQGVFFSLNHIQYSIFDLVVVVGCMLLLRAGGSRTRLYSQASASNLLRRHSIVVSDPPPRDGYHSIISSYLASLECH